MPLYVRAGSILPMGPETEYATEDPGGPIELRIYRGADAAFDLYEDSGDSYNYEEGMHAIIHLQWNDQAGVLTIGNREGSFPQMVIMRQFRIVLVAQEHGAGEAVAAEPDRSITYGGKELRVTMRR